LLKNHEAYLSLKKHKYIVNQNGSTVETIAIFCIFIKHALGASFMLFKTPLQKEYLVLAVSILYRKM
jgi:hypothetical protein